MWTFSWNCDSDKSKQKLLTFFFFLNNCFYSLSSSGNHSIMSRWVLLTAYRIYITLTLQTLIWYRAKVLKRLSLPQSLTCGSDLIYALSNGKWAHMSKEVPMCDLMFRDLDMAAGFHRDRPMVLWQNTLVSVTTSKSCCTLGVWASICLFVDPQRSIWQPAQSLNPTPICTDTTSLFCSEVNNGTLGHAWAHTWPRKPHPSLFTTHSSCSHPFISRSSPLTQSSTQLEDWLSEGGSVTAGPRGLVLRHTLITQHQMHKLYVCIVCR